MTSQWVKAPISVHAATWSTVPGTKKVLFVVHTITSANRLLDLVHLFDSDLRVQLVFTCPDASAIAAGVTELFGELGVIAISWQQAIHTEWDLAITANTSGNLHELVGPLVVVSHGVGYSKYLPGNRETGKPGNRETGKPGNRETGKPVYGLSSQSVVYGGQVVPQALVLSHTEQLDRLADAVSEALPNAVVAGDPRFDRIMASIGLRARYRAALGIAEHERLVVVSSTWASRSLFGSWPDLFRQLLAELPADRYRVAGVLHPHVWYGHGRMQVRLWLADCLRAGLFLVPPAEGWSAALIASDLVVGDHGAVTCYGAAIDKPVLLASFPAEDVAAGSCVEILGATAPPLDRGRPLLAQIEDAIHSHTTGRYRVVRELISSVPGQAAAHHRALCYQLMSLPEPDSDAAIPMLSTEGLHRGGHGPRIAAVRASGEVDEAGTVRLSRHPADVMPARLSRHPVQVDPHLAVYANHPIPTLRGCADIVFALAEDTEHANEWLTAALHVHPYCAIAAVIYPDYALVVLRRNPTVHLMLRGPAGGHADPLAGVSALYIWHTHHHDDPLPETLPVHLGTGTPYPFTVRQG